MLQSRGGRVRARADRAVRTQSSQNCRHAPVSSLGLQRERRPHPCGPLTVLATEVGASRRSSPGSSTLVLPGVTCQRSQKSQGAAGLSLAPLSCPRALGAPLPLHPSRAGIGTRSAPVHQPLALPPTAWPLHACAPSPSWLRPQGPPDEMTTCRVQGPAGLWPPFTPASPA